MFLPKFEFAIARHSPFAAGFVRSQSGTKSRFESVQVRVVFVTRLVAGSASVPPVAAPPRSPDRYLLMETFKAVLPLPKRSYAAPILGVMSFQCSPGVFGMTMFRLGTNCTGPSVWPG